MEKKICSKCKLPKVKSEFSKDKNRKDGAYPTCKECMRPYSKKHREKNREKLNKQSAEYYQKNKESILERTRSHHEKNKKRRNKQKAEYYQNTRKGYSSGYKKDNRYKLKAQYEARQHVEAPDGVHRHHWSYKEEHWIDVFLLKKSPHMRIHAKLIESEELRCYITLDGEILDTRDKHEKFILKALNLKELPRYDDNI